MPHIFDSTLKFKESPAQKLRSSLKKKESQIVAHSSSVEV